MVDHEYLTDDLSTSDNAKIISTVINKLEEAGYKAKESFGFIDIDLP